MNDTPTQRDLDREVAQKIVKNSRTPATVFFVRRNKSYDERQWEMVEDWGGEIVSDGTQEVVARCWTDAAAKAAKEEL